VIFLLIDLSTPLLLPHPAGIILSGIVGAFIVGNIANLDELEESFAEDRRPSGEAVKDDDDDYDTGGVEEIVVAPEKKEGAQ